MRCATTARRLLEDARPGSVSVLYAETSDGVALVVLPWRPEAGCPRAPNASRAARPRRSAEAAGAPAPRARRSTPSSRPRAGTASVALRIAHPAPARVLELLPLTLEDHAQELDRVRIEAVPAARRRPRRDGARGRGALALAG